MIDWILEWIVERLEAFGSWLASVVPPVPAWVGDITAGLSEIAQTAALFGAWVPWGLVVIVLGLVVVVIGIAFAIRIARIVASFLTLGGGS